MKIADRTRLSMVLVVVLCALSGAAPAHADLQVIDEFMNFTGTSVERKTRTIDQFLFLFSVGNGFLLVDSGPFGLPNPDSCCPGGVKSVALHVKQAMGLIIDDQTFLVDGEEVPSSVPGIFPPPEEGREEVREQGFFYILPLLGIEPTGNFASDFSAVMRSAARDVLRNGMELEVVLYKDGNALRVMRSGDPGVALPRDIFYMIDALPCDDSEYILELRAPFPIAGEVAGEPVEITMPMRFVAGVHVSCLHTGWGWNAPPLTQVDAIVDPTEDLCPDCSEAWYLDGPDPNEPAKDAGEMCFDVDYITDFDFFGYPAVSEDPSEMPFPCALDEDFDLLFSPWFLHNALRNSAVRLLDTVNPTPGVPEVVDAAPLSDVFTETYDGVPLELALQLEYLRIGCRATTPDKTAGLGLRSYLHAFGGNYEDIRLVRFYVKGPSGGLEHVTLPQLLQTIAWQTWDKQGAYSCGHNLVEDVPYLDLGETGAVTFLARAIVKVDGRWRPLKAIVSARAGYYVTNLYGGCIFGTEDVCGGE